MSPRPRVALPVFLVLTAGCAAPGPRTVAKATPEQQAAMFGRVQELAGDWEVRYPGQPSGVSTFKVTSGGSIVREIMFPGTDHEMTNVYHMDGPSIVVTHYCAAGNQPRMRATGVDGDALHFAFDSVTDAQPDEHCIGSLVLRFLAKDRIEQEWTTFDSKGEGQGQMTFELVRKP